MKILLLTFYYPPDLSAGSFRANALVQALQRHGGADLQVEVVTTMPNRYAAFSNAAEEVEESGSLKIRRIRVPAHDSGMTQQSRTFASYARQALSSTKGGRWDVVIATSSRLMTATLGAEVSRRSGAPLYLDIRDIFTDTMGDLLRSSPLSGILPAMRLAERWAIRRAARVNLVSPGFLDYFQQVDPSKSYRLFTNGIDDEFLNHSFAPDQETANDLPTILYAGNIGEGQGLHKIVPEAAKMLEGSARFQIIGAGGRRRQLQQAIEKRQLSNVELLQPMGREQLKLHYAAADILFLHLNDHDAFKKVLPSKLFEYAATGKPMLAGLAGYAADFVEAQIPGAELFRPCNADGLVSAFHRLNALPPIVDRAEFRKAYARARIMDEWARDILSLADQAR